MTEPLDAEKDPPMTTRLPDGTLWALERYGRRWISNRMTGELYETDPDDDSDDGDPIYRLVPLSAEAGDTDGPPTRPGHPSPSWRSDDD